MYLQELRGEVSQGDVFDSLPLVWAVPGGLVRVDDAPAVLLTYDCEYDKPSTKFVTVAQVFPLADIPADRRGNVRKNQVFSTFYLEANTLFDEAFVDLRYMGRLEKTIVAAQAQDGKRLLSLKDDAQLALQEQISAFFGYGRGR